jgi:hypothetical protein
VRAGPSLGAGGELGTGLEKAVVNLVASQTVAFVASLTGAKEGTRAGESALGILVAGSRCQETLVLGETASALEAISNVTGLTDACVLEVAIVSA